MFNHLTCYFAPLKAKYSLAKHVTCDLTFVISQTAPNAISNSFALYSLWELYISHCRCEKGLKKVFRQKILSGSYTKFNFSQSECSYQITLLLHLDNKSSCFVPLAKLIQIQLSLLKMDLFFPWFFKRHEVYTTFL